MASLLDVLIFDSVYGSWILSLPLLTLGYRLKNINDGCSISAVDCYYSISMFSSAPVLPMKYNL